MSDLFNMDQAQEGGKRTRKTKKPAATKKSATKKPTTKSTKSKGGALIDDVKNLAVPFAILLAKQGIQAMFEKKPKAETSSPKKSPKLATKRTAAGGSCGAQCAAAVATGGSACAAPLTGGKPKPRGARGGSATGAVKTRFEKLSQEIDNFLQKY